MATPAGAQASMQATLALAVSRAVTALSLVPSSSTQLSQTAVTVVLSRTPSTAGVPAVPPTGTVVLWENTASGTPIGTAVPTYQAATGTFQATLPLSNLSAGTHRLLASYAGDSNYLPTMSATVQLTLQSASVSVRVASATTVYATASTPVTVSVSTTQASFVAVAVDGTAVATGPCAVADASTSTCLAQVPTSGFSTGVHALTATVTLLPSGATTGLEVSGTGTLTISPATALLTLGRLDATYDGTAHAVTVTTTPANLAVDLSYNGLASPPAAAGTYAVAAAVRDANYTGTATAALHIAPAAAAIAFNVPPHRFGDVPFAVTATSPSTGDFLYSVVSGPATLAGNLVTLTGAGTVVLQATQAAAGNYGVGTAQSTFAIAKAVPLLAWTAPAAIAYGTPLGASQLGAAATLKGQGVPGTYTYTPAAGTVLDAGARTLQVQFAPLVPANLEGATATVPLSIQPAVTSVAFATSAVSVTSGTPVTLTATLAAVTGPVPPGVVAFTSDGLPLASVPLQNGAASLQFTFSSGTHTVVATYAGSVNQAPSSATLIQTVLQAVPLPVGSFTVSTPGSAAVTVAAGSAAALPLVVAPTATFAGAVALSCTDLPADVTCTFSAPSLLFAAGGTSQGVSVQFTAAARQALRVQRSVHTHLAWLLGIPSLLLLTRRRGRQHRHVLLLLALLLAALPVCGMLTGCGLPLPATAGTSATTAHTSTVHVVASSGSTLQTLPVALTVQ